MSSTPSVPEHALSGNRARDELWIEWLSRLDLIDAAASMGIMRLVRSSAGEDPVWDIPIGPEREQIRERVRALVQELGGPLRN